jgi:hypothetical protein
MKHLKKYLSILLSFFLITPAFSQDEEEDGQGSGESTAEAAVTGSASQPAVASSGSIESNPIVTLVRSGVSIEKAVQLSPATLVSLASSSGSFAVFESYADRIEETSGSDLTTLLDNIETAAAAGSWFAQFTSKAALISLSDTTSSAIGGTNTYLESAVALADTFITDVTLTSASNLPTDATVASLGTSVTYEMLQLLNNYGAFGSSGDSIVTASALASGQSLSAASSTSDYLTYLGTIIGKSTIDKNLKDSSGNPISVINVPTANIKVGGANKYILGSATAASTVVVDSKLPAVSTAEAESPADENIYIIGAIKDVFTAGAVTFTNTNDAEDHVLAIGAGDQVGIYHDITYTGSNLAIGQAGKATDSTKTSAINDKRALLIQADISAGGNLAIGSLGQIQVKGATFTLGTANETSTGSGVYTSDADNLYMYANDLIEINGLSFGSSARRDDVYMEAITINLKDVTFPSASDVFLRTRDGEIAFGTFSSPTVGAANFTNVVHPDVSSSALTSSDFTQQSNGQYQTTHNAITVGQL